jgi:hypothetical protein
MDPAEIFRAERSRVLDAIDRSIGPSDEPPEVTVQSAVERYIDIERRVLFPLFERHVEDGEDVTEPARARQSRMLDLIADLPVEEPDSASDALGRLREEFDSHAGAVAYDVVAALAEAVSEQRYGALGDALEEARQSIDGSDSLAPRAEWQDEAAVQ